MLCVYVVLPYECKRNWHFLLFAGFWLKILPQLYIKAVHNLEKSSGIIHTMGYVSTFILVSGESRGEEFARFFCLFWWNFATIIKSKCAHHLVLDAIFVPNLMFLHLLSPEISLGTKRSPR